jgi:hypothetical protein
MPERDKVTPDEKIDGFIAFFEGPRAEAIRNAFHDRGTYFVAKYMAPGPASPNGFEQGAGDRMRFSPATVEVPPDLRVAEDVWPFLYLRNPMIPGLSWRGIAVIGLVSLAMLILFGRRSASGRFTRLDAAMFLLGAGFMLLETKAVVHMALIFGSTWIVNTVVFSAVLVMILGANLWVLKSKPASLSLTPFYVVLLAAMILNIALPLDSFLGWPQLVQGVAAGALVLSPILCAGVIFARLFAKAEKPERALAYNTAGAILGGLAETCSLLIGFQWILAVAGAIYLASWLCRAPSRSRA